MGFEPHGSKVLESESDVQTSRVQKHVFHSLLKSPGLKSDDFKCQKSVFHFFRPNVKQFRFKKVHESPVW